MNKKEYVLRMLDALQNTRPLARGLKILVDANPINKTLLDILIRTFQETIQTISDEQQKESLKKAADFLQKLKEKETESKKQDDEDLDKLITMI